MLDTADHASLLCLPHPFRLCDGSSCLQTERTALHQPTKSSAGDQQSERGHLHSHQRRACLGWELPSEAKEHVVCVVCGVYKCVVWCARVVCVVCVHAVYAHVYHSSPLTHPC